MYEALRDEGRWVLPEALAFQARTRPDDKFVIWSTTGETLSYAKAASEADRVAGMFAAMGVGHDDAVAVMLPNGLDFVRAWLGLMRLGATAVLLNPELRGAFLEHQLKNAGCRVVLTRHPIHWAYAAGEGHRLHHVHLWHYRAGQGRP